MNHLIDRLTLSLDELSKIADPTYKEASLKVSPTLVHRSQGETQIANRRHMCTTGLATVDLAIVSKRTYLRSDILSLYVLKSVKSDQDRDVHGGNHVLVLMWLYDYGFCRIVAYTFLSSNLYSTKPET